MLRLSSRSKRLTIISRSDMDLVEAIRKQKLKSLIKSNNASKAFDNRIKDLAAKQRFVKNTGEVNIKAILRATYYSMLEDYTGKKSFAKRDWTKRSEALWGRVESAYETSGVELDHFMKAQFSYFHRVFGRAPKPHQLTTEGAVFRAQNYSGSKARVIGNDIRHKTTVSERFKLADKQMREICHAQNKSRKEVYEDFVIPGFICFPQDYLDADPTYKALVK
jgi:hypothetical protein